MLFREAKPGARVESLKPFVLKLKDGFLLGLGRDPQEGSPCIQCAELWLSQRRVSVERMHLDDLLIRRDLIKSMVAENNPHVFHEISMDGTSTRLDCLVFPHPTCTCKKSDFLPPVQTSPRTNFAFSPVYQIKCARYGTPNGNLWLTSAAGTPASTGSPIQVYAAGREREESRFKAVDEWMKRAAFADLSSRLVRGQKITGADLVTGQTMPLFESSQSILTPEGMGAGATREEALLNALMALAKARTLNKFSSALKTPMLVVGTNNWIRGKVPFFLLQQYDLHLLFYPNSTQAWVVGVAALSRLRTDEAPIFVFGVDSDVNKAIDMALFKMLERCRPADWVEEDESESMPTMAESQKNAKMGVWWNHWIYRCAKINLKEILHLEPYGSSTEVWKQYFADGQEKLSVISLNTPALPEQLRVLVKLQGANMAASSRNVRGIGTFASFGDALI